MIFNHSLVLYFSYIQVNLVVDSGIRMVSSTSFKISKILYSQDLFLKFSLDLKKRKDVLLLDIWFVFI